MPVSSLIDSLPFATRADNPHNFLDVGAYLWSLAGNLYHKTIHNKIPNQLNYFIASDLLVFSWQSDSHFTFDERATNVGKKVQRHIIYDFPRVLLLDRNISENIHDSFFLHALFLKCDRKDGYVYAGQTLSIENDYNIKSSFFGNANKNIDICTPYNLLKTAEYMLSPIFTHNQENSRHHSS